jgi:hypothetical protein
MRVDSDPSPTGESPSSDTTRGWLKLVKRIFSVDATLNSVPANTNMVLPANSTFSSGDLKLHLY